MSHLRISRLRQQTRHDTTALTRSKGTHRWQINLRGRKPVLASALGGSLFSSLRCALRLSQAAPHALVSCTPTRPIADPRARFPTPLSFSRPSPFCPASLIFQRPSEITQYALLVKTVENRGHWAV